MIWRVLTDAGTEASGVAAGTWLMNLAGLSADAGEAGWQGDPGREKR
jgi:hypothetical protein